MVRERNNFTSWQRAIFLSLARKSALISKDNCMRTRSVCGFLDGLAPLNQCAHFISGWTPYEAQKKTRESCPQ